jgi:hypothetical protein
VLVVVRLGVQWVENVLWGKQRHQIEHIDDTPAGSIVRSHYVVKPVGKTGVADTGTSNRVQSWTGEFGVDRNI